MEFYTRYNPNPDKCGYMEFSKGRTQQQFKDECDINVIVQRAMVTGTLDPNDLNPNSPIFADFENVPDFMTAMNAINAAADDFNALDPRIRSRFNNNPAELLDFLSHQENYDEAVSLGFIHKKEEPVDNVIVPNQAPDVSV